MRVLFIENNDSFSWNVIDVLPFERNQVDVVAGPVLIPFSKSHSIDPVQFIKRDSDTRTVSMNARLENYDAVVIGPGPMDPIRTGLLDVVNQAAELKIPTLGICLGHQAIGLTFGAELVRIPPMHGKISQIHFKESRFFSSYNKEETVMRYHSLSLINVHSPLHVTARALDDSVMAVEHESLPMLGIQFHPDSYATPNGRDMISQFFKAVL